MVRIRLWRMGAKKRPFYRVVVADSRSPRDGRIIESLGTYDPGTDPVSVSIDPERARYWLSCGAFGHGPDPVQEGGSVSRGVFVRFRAGRGGVERRSRFESGRPFQGRGGERPH